MIPRSSQCCYLLLGPLEALNSVVILQGSVTLTALGGVRYLQFPICRMNGSIKPSRGFAVILVFSAYNGSLSADGPGRLCCSSSQPKWPVFSYPICLVLFFLIY